MGYKSHAQRKAVHASKAEKKSGASQKKFPEIKEKNQGKFTAWVEKNMSGKTTCKAASVIVNKNKEEEKKGVKPNKRTYKPAVLKMANYAKNFGCSTKKDGSSMDHGKKGGASFNPKLRKAVADGKIKGKFADAVMGASYGAYGSSEPGKTISAKKFERKAKRNKNKITATASSSTTPRGFTSSKKKTVVNKKNKRFVKGEQSITGGGKGATSVEYYKQRKGKHY